MVRHKTSLPAKPEQAVKDYGLNSPGSSGLADAKEDSISLAESALAKPFENSIASPSLEGQAAFDKLKQISSEKTRQDNNLGRLEDLALRRTYQAETTKGMQAEQNKILAGKVQKKARTEQNVLPEAGASAKNQPYSEIEAQSRQAPAAVQPAIKPLRIRTFESAIDPFEFSQLDSGHFVLFRKVWMNGQRYIQGLLINQQDFLQGAINAAFQETGLSQMCDLAVAFQGNVLSAFSGRSPRGYLSSAGELNGELLYQAHLADPLSELQLIFSITQLPVGPGGWVIIWLTILLSSVFLAGFYLLYRLGLGQINLINQQQDFVSAVSHELKTPLTSIRMYSEMLKSNWVDENKKQSYYDFILDESERLSRLINNVLQLAKMTRNTTQTELKSLTIAELMDAVQSKVSTQVERAGFELKLTCDHDAGQTKLKVNQDWFIQIIINLVDNAIKFSTKADKKTIELACKKLTNRQIQISVRDYGPGIAKNQLKKIFKLFYRAENELNRETVVTGIGLALTHQMIIGMNGQIDVVNRNPGAEFRINFIHEKS